jgi:hypothetical protein
MSDEEKAVIYRQSDEFLLELVRDEPQVRAMLEKAREKETSPKLTLPPVTDWMCGEA